ncbi:antibiotic biosynthesis monooxygenase family protein [Amycolatopsis sp. H20-H5]|uniref:antibiotic biosynthesis monooxygenase family protein n=1 Tax=Amycolatopsis sp. H20-H5 TaxID=3046309 RepID=UPI002DB6E0AC|nr:hypothetical protein [Amycolatopsis sp. H20-H5]MEC3981910.1 hypothetical protein [Amycolatopsis sp. H20-H5]
MRSYPEPLYYVVVFASRRTEGDNGYSEEADHLGELAAQQPGYLGHDAARSGPELGITVSYWKDEESIAVATPVCSTVDEPSPSIHGAGSGAPLNRGSP